MYDWIYVDKLYKGLKRNLNKKIKLHVYTEPGREVPDKYIKHPLKDLSPHGASKGWWYKVQLFDRTQFSGQLLYLDLDVAISGSLDWILDCDPKYFWGIRDFRYLFNQRKRELNSSLMYFNVDKFGYIWEDFKLDPGAYMSRLHGDQNYIDKKVPPPQMQFFDEKLVRSWRWELLDGGYDINTHRHKAPGTGTFVDDTRVIVFHGKPKLHEISDPVIDKYW